MTPLERAALALVEAYPCLPREQRAADDPAILDVARAVIAAIREPNQAVLKTMRDTLPVDGHEWEYVEDDAAPHWRAMIDALLD